ncbi:MAG: hypothetical protein AB7O67_01965 [Vicinamibacterales bacterium]
MPDRPEGRRGRPPRDPNGAASERVQLRVTPAELASWQAFQTRNGYASLGDAIRLVFGDAVLEDEEARGISYDETPGARNDG